MNLNGFHILVTPEVTEDQKQRLIAAAPEAEFIFRVKSEISEEDLAEADIILGNLQDPAQLHFCRRLKWIQLNNAGTEGYCDPGIVPEGAILANATGAYGMAISEHMIAAIFDIKRKFALYMEHQKNHLWKHEGTTGIIDGSTVLVLGAGDIGMTFGKKMHALGCKVYGIRRRPGECPEWMEELCGLDQIDRLLPVADIVALSLPGYADTYHILNRERIALMKETAILLNVDRGTAIETEALTDALYERKIFAAALDVTDPEPLPADHRLWDAPGALITPHVSGGYAQPETLDRIVNLFVDNLKRYQDGQPIEQVVDIQTGYIL